MGIKKLRSLLRNMDLTAGIETFESLSKFIDNEKSIMLSKLVQNEKITDPTQLLLVKERISKKFISVAIDTSIYAVKYKRIFKRIEYGFLIQILKFVSNGILPIYIFDGVQPDEKKSTIGRRIKRRKNAETKLMENVNNANNTKQVIDVSDIMNQIIATNNDVLLFNNKYIDKKDLVHVNLIKRTLNPTKKDMLDLQSFMKLISVPYLCAINEADELLTYLLKNKIVSVCLSEDSDLIVRGCDNIIYTDDNGVHNYKLPYILKELDMSYNSFVDMCVVMSNEYGNKIEIIPDLYTYFKDPKNNLQKYVETYGKNQSVDKWLKIKDTYTQCNCTNAITYSSIKNNFKLQAYDYNVIKNYFTGHKITFDNSLENKIYRLVKNANIRVYSQ